MYINRERDIEISISIYIYIYVRIYIYIYTYIYIYMYRVREIRHVVYTGAQPRHGCGRRHGMTHALCGSKENSMASCKKDFVNIAS